MNYKLIEEDGKLKFKGSYGSETIHVIHSSETLEDLKEECEYGYNPYLVVEEFGNFGRVHLITSRSQDESLQTVHEYIQENECEDLNDIKDIHLIGVFECDL